MSQKMLIRIVLGVLGAGVVLALVTALAGTDDDQVVGAIVSAVCAGCAAVVIVLSAHWLSPRTRPVVVYALWAAAVIGAGMIAGAFWAASVNAYNTASGLAGGGVAVALLGVPTAIALHLMVKPRGRFACLAALASLGLALAAWLGAGLLAGGDYHVWSTLFGAGWCAVVYGGFATAQLIGFEPGRPVTWWRWGAVMISAGAAVFTVYALAVEMSDDDWLPWFAASSALAMALAQGNAVGVTPLPGKLRWLKPVTIGVGAVACVLGGVWLQYVNVLDFDSAIMRVALAGLILGGAMTLGVFVLAWMARVTPQERHVYLDEMRVALACPNCGTSQRVGTGRSACVTCGMWLHVRCEEPRCPNCDYVLYHAASDVCPECGHELHVERGQSMDVVATAGMDSSANAPAS